MGHDKRPSPGIDFDASCFRASTQGHKEQCGVQPCLAVRRSIVCKEELVSGRSAFRRFSVSLAGIGLFLALPLCAEQLYGRPPETLLGQRGAALWPAIAEANVIYVGETHDKQSDHRYELRLIRDMIRRRLAFSIGWEMFDQTQQKSLDAWDRGAISMRRLYRDTGFDRAWAVYSQIYGKILETAQRSGRNNVALNAPPDLVRKVAHGRNLSRQEKALLPRGFTSSRAAYRNFVGLMGDHPGLSAGHLRSFFAAQNVWDQTMADRILRFERWQSGVTLVVLIGRGHVANGFGIPFYVGQKGALQQLILLP
jgi:uncharacterized iron-regulated protein